MLWIRLTRRKTSRKDCLPSSGFTCSRHANCGDNIYRLVTVQSEEQFFGEKKTPTDCTKSPIHFRLAPTERIENKKNGARGNVGVDRYEPCRCARAPSSRDLTVCSLTRTSLKKNRTEWLLFLSLSLNIHANSFYPSRTRARLTNSSSSGSVFQLF